MNRWHALAAAALVLAGCSGREEKSLVTHGTLTIERPFATGAIAQVEGRWFDAHAPRAQFEAAWDVVVRGSPSASALALTLAGGAPADPQGVTVLAALVVVLPAPLQPGTRYDIGAAIAPPSETEMPMYWQVWGPRRLTVPGSADVALRVFDYHAVGMRVEHDFIARVATGSVEVLRRAGDGLELRLDVTATDAAGKVLRVHGNFEVRGERYTPPAT